MSTKSLYRWSGIALIIGSLLGLVGTVLDVVLFPGEARTAQQILSLPFTLDATLYLFWAILVTLGLPGFYLYQAQQAGRLGFTGFILTMVGTLLGAVGFALVQLTVFPYLAEGAPALLPGGDTGPVLGFVLWILVPGVLLAVGSILLGIASRRAAIFPRPIGALLIVSGVAFLLSIPPLPSPLGNFTSIVANIVIFAALAWAGYLLMAREPESAPTRSQSAIGAGVSR
jgi:hypothetical protein